MTVRIFNATLDEEDERPGGIIIRGVLDQASLKYINMAWYQRERGFSQRHTDQLIGAYFANATIADITLGMRGSRTSSKGSAYSLLDKCYCIDGGQRIYAAGMALKERPDLKINLGAKVYLNTTDEFENELFCKLGTTQVKIGPSILIRNRMKRSPASKLLDTISRHPDFALKNRVAWDQRRTVHELMSGYQLCRIVGALHAHKVGGLRASRPYDLLDALDLLFERIGTESMTGNVLRFFDAIDKCWTMRQLSGGRDESRPHLKSLFLQTVARLFSAYPDFWDGRNDFYFADKFVKKLRKFALSEYLGPTKGLQTELLYEILRKKLGLNPLFENSDDLGGDDDRPATGVSISAP
jgi:hypothetical protein